MINRRISESTKSIKNCNHPELQKNPLAIYVVLIY